MTIQMWKKKIGVSGETSISEDHELKLGEYNEFYLPLVDREHELWVLVVDDDGNETRLHLKR